jgi:hypothetical protein
MKFACSLPAAALLGLFPSMGFAQFDASVANVLLAHLDTPPATYAAMDLPAPEFSSSNAPSLFDDAGQSSTYPRTATPTLYTEGGGPRPFSGVAAAIKVGTAGIGFDVATPLIRRHVNLRGGASFFSYSTTIAVDDLNVVGSLKFQSAAAMVDLFPFGGGFRISGGMTFKNQTGLNATLVPTPGQTFTVDNVDYYSQPYDKTLNPAGPITGTGVFNFGGATAPRVTFGWGNMLKERGRIAFLTEFGFEYISTPTVVYNITGTGCQNYNGAGTANAANYSNCGPIPPSNVAAQQATLQNDLNPYRFFPIISIGLSYKLFQTH